jgi:very-short-patch-repair endonuclease
MGKLKTTEQFIKDAITKHGDKYDYSKVEYNGNKPKIIIICKTHGEFLQCPNTHLNGANCPTCAGCLRIDTEEFIKQSKLVHGDHFDYSKVEYKNCDTHVVLICKIHGDFIQTPYNHLKSKNCARCRGNQKTSKQFIEESIIIHGDKYDYSKVDYKNTTTKVIIICKIHGEIEQLPSSHLSGQGCYKCGNNILKTREEFIQDSKKLHGDKYDYSKVDYKGAHIKVILGCSEHGKFETEPNCNLRGSGCYKCGKKEVSKKLSSNKEEFIEKSKKIFGDKYDYSKVEYNGNKKKIIIICKSHGEFLQKPNGHLDGDGCIRCINKTEGKLYEKLKPFYPNLIIQFKQEWCKNISYLPFDFCIQEYKIIIELDGPQHFQQISNWSSPEKQFENDKYKEKCANDNGYSVIRILQEDVFYDTYDWLKDLCETIEEIKNGDEIVNVYLCKNDEYTMY